MKIDHTQKHLIDALGLNATHIASVLDSISDEAVAKDYSLSQAAELVLERLTKEELCMLVMDDINKLLAVKGALVFLKNTEEINRLIRDN